MSTFLWQCEICLIKAYSWHWFFGPFRNQVHFTSFYHTADLASVFGHQCWNRLLSSGNVGLCGQVWPLAFKKVEGPRWLFWWASPAAALSALLPLQPVCKSCLGRYSWLGLCSLFPTPRAGMIQWLPVDSPRPYLLVDNAVILWYAQPLGWAWVWISSPFF